MASQVSKRGKEKLEKNLLRGSTMQIQADDEELVRVRDRWFACLGARLGACFQIIR